MLLGKGDDHLFRGELFHTNPLYYFSAVRETPGVQLADLQPKYIHMA